MLTFFILNLRREGLSNHFVFAYSWSPASGKACLVGEGEVPLEAVEMLGMFEDTAEVGAWSWLLIELYLRVCFMTHRVVWVAGLYVVGTRIVIHVAGERGLAELRSFFCSKPILVACKLRLHDSLRASDDPQDCMSQQESHTTLVVWVAAKYRFCMISVLLPGRHRNFANDVVGAGSRRVLSQRAGMP